MTLFPKHQPTMTDSGDSDSGDSDSGDDSDSYFQKYGDWSVERRLSLF